MKYITVLAIVIAAAQAGIAAALGAQVSGFPLPAAVTFALVVAGPVLAVVSANLPAVSFGHGNTSLNATVKDAAGAERTFTVTPQH